MSNPLQPPPLWDSWAPRADGTQSPPVQDFLVNSKNSIVQNAPADARYVLNGLPNAALADAQALGQLSTGILKVTTTSGDLTVAVPADFPALNQSTTGSAATLTTPRLIAGQSFNGSANVAIASTDLTDATQLVHVRANGRVTAQSGAVGSVSTYTVGASDGSFTVSANINVTTSTLHNFTVTCTYTDETNASRTLTLGFTQLSGATLLTAVTNATGAGPYESLVYHLRCKAATSITVATTGTFTTVTYNAEGIITQVA